MTFKLREKRRKGPPPLSLAQHFGRVSIRRKAGAWHLSSARLLHELLRQGLKRSPQSSASPLLPSREVERRLPENLLRSDEPVFRAEEKRFLGPVQLETLHDVLITDSGVLLQRFRPLDRFLVDETHKRFFGRKYALWSFLTKQRIELPDDDYVYPMDYWSDGYFHWLGDAIPRITALGDRVRELVLLVPETFDSYHLESLQAFPFKAIQRIPVGCYVAVPRLMVPTQVAPSGHFNPDVMRTAQRNFWRASENKGHGSKTPARIYISREKAARRKVLNELQVIGFLTDYGFETLCLETYTLTEQVRLLRSAQCVVGLHGSGLTNMIFMPEGAHVIELRREADPDNLCFFTLASAMNLHYWYVSCTANPPDASTQDADFRVPLPELASTVKQALGNGRNH